MRTDNYYAGGRALSVLLDRTLLVLSAVTTAILFAWLLYYSGYGLNPTDEGFYLNFMANPFAYALNLSATLFGFVGHWPYQWAGGDIAVLRMANVMLIMALGWMLSFLVIRRLWIVGRPRAAVLSAGMASLTLVAFRTRTLLTPNYYTLSIQSLFIVMIGLLLADQPGRLRQVSGSILVGVGGWCCFMAKPTTAAAIALVVMLYVVILRRNLVLALLGASLIALTLLMVTAYWIDGGISGLVTRMIKSAEMETVLGAGHEVSLIFRIDWLDTNRWQLAIALLTATALLLSIFVGSMNRLLPFLALAAVSILTIAIALLGSDPISLKPSALFLIPAFTCLGAVFCREGLVLRTQAPTSITLALIFFFLPHVHSLGSNVNYWICGSTAALFWMLAVVAFLSPLAQQGRSAATLLPLTVLAQLLTASVVNSGILNPSHQAKDVRTYTAVMAVWGGGKLVLSPPFRNYLTTARAQAHAAGLEVGSPVVDLSDSPTLLYVLGTRMLGLPWLIGGFSGSSAVAIDTLGFENCADLAKAWVLIEPDGPHPLDQTGVMSSFGAGQADYVVAATFETPFIEENYPSSARQFLLKPLRPAPLAEQSCREARRHRADSR